MGHRQPLEFKNKGRSEQGFTLLEVFFALAIFTFGLLAVAAMQVTSVNSNASARMHTEGYTWAVDRIEWMTGLSYDHTDLTAGTHQSEEEPYRISWTVQDDTPIEDTKTIRVTVSEIRNRSKAFTLSFIKGI